MKNKMDLATVLPALEAMEAKDVTNPTMPVATYLQEAEDLYVWMQADRAHLESVGQSPEMMDSIPARIGALRELESAWGLARHGKDEAQTRYDAMSRDAFSLFTKLVRHARYAFRKHPGLQARLPRTTGWISDTDRIQDINDLAVICREHSGLLAEAGFDTALLDCLGTLSDDLANKKALARRERAGGRGTKLMRDRAFTYLKEAIDEVRAAGRFLFWDDAARLQGYRSAYWVKPTKPASDVDDVREIDDGPGEDTADAGTPSEEAPTTAGSSGARVDTTPAAL